MKATLQHRCMVGLFSALAALYSVSQSATPNVVLIIADDLGIGDINAYNRRIPTPHIDSLAAIGVKFSDFYASPLCTPSRYQILTGSYSCRSLHGLNEVIRPESNFYIDSTAEITLAQRAKTIGYESALIGKWHLGHIQRSYLPDRHGFASFTGFAGGYIDYWAHNYGVTYEDWYIDGVKKKETGYTTDLLTTHAISFIRQRVGDKKPFYLSLMYSAPHYGKTDANNIPPYTFIVGEKSAGNYSSLQAQLPYLKRFPLEKDSLTKYYSAMVSNLDDGVGSVVGFLRENNLLENTIIWFISDNGGDPVYGGNNAQFKGAKNTIWEGGVRVASILVWKGTIPGNKVSSQAASTVDIVPTLAALLGFSKTGGQPIDGINLCANIFKGETAPRDLFWMMSQGNALRSGKWKYKDGALYNLATDPGETTNLASTFPDTLNRLKALFNANANAIQNKRPANPNTTLSDYVPNLTRIHAGIKTKLPESGRVRIHRTSSGIRFSCSDNIRSWKIADMQGRVICHRSDTKSPGPVPVLSNGVYVLTVTTRNAILSQLFSVM